MCRLLWRTALTPNASSSPLLLIICSLVFVGEGKKEQTSAVVFSVVSFFSTNKIWLTSVQAQSWSSVCTTIGEGKKGGGDFSESRGSGSATPSALGGCVWDFKSQFLRLRLEMLWQKTFMLLMQCNEVSELPFRCKSQGDDWMSEKLMFSVIK